jgi:transposase
MPLPSVRRMQTMSKHYPVEQRERAVKMVLDHLDEYRSVYAACHAVGPKVGVGAESLRRWVLQAQVDAWQSPGVTTAEQQRFKDLERENRDLKEDNEILRCRCSTSTSLAYPVAPPPAKPSELNDCVTGCRISGSSAMPTTGA